MKTEREGGLLDDYSGAEPGFFWIDNNIMDRHLPVLGVQTTMIYMCLARQSVRSVFGHIYYPSLRSIASACRVQPRTVRASLARLVRAGLLNQSDVQACEDSELNELRIDSLHYEENGKPITPSTETVANERSA